MQSNSFQFSQFVLHMRINDAICQRAVMHLYWMNHILQADMLFSWQKIFILRERLMSALWYFSMCSTIPLLLKLFHINFLSNFYTYICLYLVNCQLSVLFVFLQWMFAVAYVSLLCPSKSYTEKNKENRWIQDRTKNCFYTNSHMIYIGQKGRRKAPLRDPKRIVITNFEYITFFVPNRKKHIL